MDVARSSVRLGAEKVSIVYRRRKEDMTALEEEVAGAEAEGCDILELMSPVRIEKDKNDKVVGLWVQPQMISKIKGGRPSPKTAAKDEVLIPCDLMLWQSDRVSRQDILRNMVLQLSEELLKHLQQRNQRT